MNYICFAYLSDMKRVTTDPEKDLKCHNINIIDHCVLRPYAEEREK